MIKVNCGHIEVQGPKILIEAELATLFHYWADNGTFTKEKLQEIVNDGFLTEEELDDRIEKQEKENGITDEQKEHNMQMIGALVDLMQLFGE